MGNKYLNLPKFISKIINYLTKGKQNVFVKT